MKILIFVLLISSSAFSNNDIKKLDWNGLEVVWLKDNSVPTYSVQVYFADGALSDPENKVGETDLMFSQLFSGTNRYTQKDIHDNLEYFGVNYSSNVFHEYSTFSYSGLVKDLIPVSKKICHLFNDSTFPDKELKNTKKRMTSYLTNMESDHSQLANRLFRRLSLRGTDFEMPVDGTISSIRRVGSKDLKRKLNYLNNKVKKKLYLRGSEDILKIKDILIGECGWNADQSFVRQVNDKQSPKALKTRIALFPVKNANQAQIRVGRFLKKDEINDPDLLSLMSGYLGSGFTSLLYQELRLKRGFTYSVSAIASAQKHYGRSFVMTFSKNETVADTVRVVKDLLNSFDKEEFVNSQRMAKSVKYLKGNHLFQFESNDSFIRSLMFMDHVNRPWDSLYDFPNKLDSYVLDDLKNGLDTIFDWDNSVVVIVGSKELIDELKKVDSTQVLKYRSYL